jgi:phosphoribosyl-ATP pyrophosphohydrolase
MKYKLYHIPGKKIGVTLNLKHRVEVQQGYRPGEYEVLEESNDIGYISNREIELQKEYGYRVDETEYKNLNQNQSNMRINTTEQTTTFPCPASKLKGRLMDELGMKINTPHGNYELTPELARWIQNNAETSQFNKDRCYVYNKAMSNFFKTERILNTDNPQGSIFSKIRVWANNKGILSSGNTQTQYIKLMEEAGELAEGLLKKDKPEIKDAIGDMIVVLTNLAALEGMDIEDCIQSAYNEIKDRVGVMENGTFVKFNTKTLS